MLALSTSWIADRLSNPRELVQALNTAGIEAVELEYRLTPALLDRLRSALTEAGVIITSLHNYCPFPGITPKAKPSGDYFRLSAVDMEERKLAVQWTARTIENAHEMEARIVVLHCGAVGEGPDSRILMETLNRYGRDSEELRDRLALAAELRQQARGPFIDALLFSLDHLLRIAERHGVILALENRYHYHELPGYDDLAFVLQRFEGAPLGYWHDTGHAHALQMLGVCSQESWLTRYGSQLIGLHLHDAQGLKDHLPPGEGEIDWRGLQPYLQHDRPLVLELVPGTELSQICRAADFVRGLLAEKKIP
jgi:sugar phosphate isomerase/epimerase